MRWNLCLSLQAGTVTMSQIAWTARKLQQTAGRPVKETGWGGGQCRACCLCPSHCPRPAPGTVKEPTYHQGHADGLFSVDVGVLQT